ncbi:MAG: TraR/DksA C4-type zinc finger protein [Chloroflexi bacterium]|nr:TraR/DksA C4-type zinc finger protein [Chloroflexota bacterium]
MTPTDLAPELKQELTTALRRERARLLRSVEMLGEAERALGASQAEESGAAGDDADVASDLAEQELDLALEQAELQRVRLIDETLTRLARGVYGPCEVCREPIDPARLRALPWTTRCVQCARRASALA